MRRRNWMLSSLLTLAAGCMALDGDSDRLSDEWTDATADGLVRIDVFPPSSAELRDVRGVLLELRPHTFTREVVEDSAVVLSLTPAVNLGGVITGSALTPLAATEIPTVDGPLAGAEVRFDLEGTVQQPRTTTADDGVYDVPVVPDDLPYTVSIVPLDPLLPVTSTQVSVGAESRVRDFDIAAGVPVWGKLTYADGRPLVGARVHAVNERGIEGASALTDDQGRYLVAVSPDETWTIVSEGREGRQDPTVRASTGLVGEHGTRVDLGHGIGSLGTLRGAVRLPSGAVPSDDAVSVRVVSTSLGDFGEDLSASFEETVGISNGEFTVVVPVGTYRVEISPQEVSGPSPIRLDPIEAVGGIEELGTLTLPSQLTRFGEVLDESGEPVAGVDLTCTELGFAGRSRLTTTDPAGQFLMQVPDTPMRCRLTPPVTRPDLALTRVDLIDDSYFESDEAWTLEIVEGSVVRGQIRARREPVLDDSVDSVELANAIVEVRTDSGDLLGVGTSDQDGNFTVRIAR